MGFINEDGPSAYLSLLDKAKPLFEEISRLEKKVESFASALERLGNLLNSHGRLKYAPSLVFARQLLEEHKAELKVIADDEKKAKIKSDEATKFMTDCLDRLEKKYRVEK